MVKSKTKYFLSKTHLKIEAKLNNGILLNVSLIGLCHTTRDGYV